MKLFADAYNGRRILLTGHTGFKGSWLALWLRELGAIVTGVSLPPEAGLSHWALLDLPIDSRYIDIRSAAGIAQVVQETQPEIVFHLAAQSLVRRSYREPLETWSTNVMGTANLLEACRQAKGLRAIVVVTTDKCYENHEWPWGYRETDRLGGHDPYSASKAGAELLAASYRTAFFCHLGAPLLATARAGNVIGGGDWSEDRLIPDIVRAFGENNSLEIRSPNATRPWQHVLDALSGYLILGQRLLEGDRDCADAWNFGPESDGRRTVSEVLDKITQYWPSIRWHPAETPQPHEANALYLDSSKARTALHWQTTWATNATLAATVEWYQAWMEKKEIISRQQLAEYIKTAAQGSSEWARP